MEEDVFEGRLVGSLHDVGEGAVEDDLAGVGPIEAAEEMEQALFDSEMRAPLVPVYVNVDAAPVADPGAIRHLLVRQVTGMVRWRESVLAMHAAGVTHLVELGGNAVGLVFLPRGHTGLQAKAMRFPASAVAGEMLVRIRPDRIVTEAGVAAMDCLPEELAGLDRYLERPGQLLVLLDPEQAPRLAAGGSSKPSATKW